MKRTINDDIVAVAEAFEEAVQESLSWQWMILPMLALFGTWMFEALLNPARNHQRALLASALGPACMIVVLGLMLWGKNPKAYKSMATALTLTFTLLVAGLQTAYPVKTTPDNPKLLVRTNTEGTVAEITALAGDTIHNLPGLHWWRGERGYVFYNGDTKTVAKSQPFLLKGQAVMLVAKLKLTPRILTVNDFAGERVTDDYFLLHKQQELIGKIDAMVEAAVKASPNGEVTDAVRHELELSINVVVNQFYWVTATDLYVHHIGDH